jgi:hypothetical protein
LDIPTRLFERGIEIFSNAFFSSHIDPALVSITGTEDEFAAIESGNSVFSSFIKTGQSSSKIYSASCKMLDTSFARHLQASFKRIR